MQQRVDGNLGCDADVADRLRALDVPFADVEQPFRGAQVFEHVAELRKDHTILFMILFWSRNLLA